MRSLQSSHRESRDWQAGFMHCCVSHPSGILPWTKHYCRPLRCAFWMLPRDLHKSFLNTRLRWRKQSGVHMSGLSCSCVGDSRHCLSHFPQSAALHMATWTPQHHNCSLKSAVCVCFSPGNKEAYARSSDMQQVAKTTSTRQLRAGKPCRLGTPWHSSLQKMTSWDMLMQLENRSFGQ